MIFQELYIYDELSSKLELYNENEYINIPQLFKSKYGYSIKKYMATLFSVYYFHIGENRYKVFNKELFIIKMKNKNKVNEIFNEMSKRYYEYKEWAMETVNNSWDYEELVKYPIFQLNADEYVSLDESFIVNKFFEALYYKVIDIYEDNRDRSKIISFLGRTFEMYVGIVVKEAINKSEFAYKYIEEFDYGKSNSKSSDAYILISNIMLIIEAKASRPVRSSFIGDDEESIIQAINKLYINPIKQANKAYEQIMKSNHKKKFENINDIYIITVSLENVPFTKEVKQIVNYNIEGTINNKVKGYCNLNIEEYELLCSILNNDINGINIISEYCKSCDAVSLKHFVPERNLNFKIEFLNQLFARFTKDMVEHLFI